MRTAFVNASLISADSIITNQTVVVNGKTIEYVGNDGSISLEDTRTIFLNGLYLAPGLIDLHVHGAKGRAFMQADYDALQTISDYHASHGITSMLLTTTCASEKETTKALAFFARNSCSIDSCNLLGVHLEGPYLNPEQCGAQNPCYMTLPDFEQCKRFTDFGVVKRITIAPELPGALEMGAMLAERGIIVSAGHTSATYDDITRAMRYGYTCLTHFYSGMESIRRRNAFRVGGAVEAGLLHEDLITEIIADGCHLPECLLKLIYKCKGTNKIILTSDATQGAGFENGCVIPYEEGREIVIEDDVAKLLDRSSFAGSVASGNRLLKSMVKIAGVPVWEAVKMGTENPAKMLGIYNIKGSVTEGKDADLIVFDDDFNMKYVMTGGKLVLQQK